MLSRTIINNLIDETESEYQKCWEILSGLKKGELTDSFIRDSLDFQIMLASAIFRLDETYRTLTQEQRHTIAKKKSLTDNWFRHRMRTLHEYQEIINEGIRLGKALGDSYAWMFYHNERDLLLKHLEHEEVTHTPPGVGGKGEFEFIRNVKALNGHLTIYHGITTILRIGDVSFIDLKNLKVTAIGEIKTTSVTPSHLEINMHWIASPKYTRTLSRKSKVEPIKQSSTLPLKMQEKLKKQVKQMVTTFEISKPNKKLTVNQSDYTNELKNLATSLEKSTVAYEKAGEGLMLVGIKSKRPKALSAKLLGKSNHDLNKLLGGITKQAVQLIDKSQVDPETNLNSLYIGHLNLHLLRGMIPIFWWNVPIDFLRDIFFRHVAVITLYNPAHLLRRLKMLGYEIERNGRDYKVSKRIGDSSIELSSMEYFLSAIQNSLMHEDFVVEILSTLTKQIESGKVPPNSKIDLKIEQSFGGAKS
jgi:hypothetical protein